MHKIFFDNWHSIERTLIIGVLAYLALVLFLRISGKRTLSKMNAFDFIVTVALGSTLASILLSKDVSLAQGALGLALLVALQFLITWSSLRASWVRRIVTGEPSMLFYRGEFLREGLRSARVTKGEILAAVRASGMAALENVEAVVLETDGSFSVVPRAPGSSSSALADVSCPSGGNDRTSS